MSINKKTIGELAAMLDISPQRLNYWLRKPDAPESEYRFKYGRMMRHYDEREVKSYWEDRE